MSRIKGRVSSIVFRDEYTGKTIACLVPEDLASRSRKAGLVSRISGHFAHPLFENEVVEVEGTWITETIPERRVLHVQSMTRVPPSTREGEILSLSSYIKGLSRKGAAELLETVGGMAQLREICLDRPSELESILPGARRKGVRYALRSFPWDRSELDIDLVNTLYSAGRGEMQGGGISTDQINKMVRYFGAGPLKAVLQSRPYDVVDVPGIGFTTADKIAFFYATQQGRAFNALDPERLRHAVRDVLGQERGSGHVCVSEKHLIQRVLFNLRSPNGTPLKRDARTTSAIQAAITEALTLRTITKDHDSLYTLGMHKAEVDLAMQIFKLMRSPNILGLTEKRKVREYLAQEEKTSGIALTDEQTEAVLMALGEPLCIITGGPGVGKTLVASRIIGALKHLKRTFKMVAPTGKAAKRASDVAQEEAQTIHRACNLDIQGDIHSRRFGRSLQRLDYFRDSTLLVDESSMVDLLITYEFLRRVRPGQTRVVLIGDVDQLPAVGPGQVLRDLIDSERIPVTRLTETRRQAGGSPIIDGSRAINTGKVPVVPPDSYEARILDPTTSKAFVSGPDEEANAALEGSISKQWLLYSIRRYAEAQSLDPARDIQVYSPERRGPCGITELNRELRAFFNPLPPDLDTRRGRCIRIHTGYIIQPGCKVMQRQNHYYMRFAESAPDEAYDEYRSRLKQQERDKLKRNRGKKGNRTNKAPGQRPDTDVVPVMNGQVGFVTRVDPSNGEMEVLFDDLPHPVLYRNSSEWGKLEPAWCISIHKSQGSETPYAFIVLHSGMYMLNRPLLYTAWTRAKKGVLLIAPATEIERAVSTEEGTQRGGNLRKRLEQTLPHLNAK